ncbi:hypothetical protein N9C96_00870 [bacterium]|nr:hypothetical protein [bacterium]
MASFWTGLGAVRRDVFKAIGGFDETIAFMEDVDLGLRLQRKGHSIVLCHDAFGTHLKQWTLGSMLQTDLFGRAIPWSRLITAPDNKDIPTPLTAGPRGKLSVIAVAVSLIGLPLSLFLSPWAILTALLALGGLIALHSGFFSLLRQAGKPGDRLAAIGILWLIYLMAGLGYAYVLAERIIRLSDH